MVDGKSPTVNAAQLSEVLEPFEIPPCGNGRNAERFADLLYGDVLLLFNDSQYLRTALLDIECPHLSFCFTHEVLWLDVHELDLVGVIEDVVGNPLAHDDARDRTHTVVEALEVLDVDGGIHVDARREELLDVLVALCVA